MARPRKKSSLQVGTSSPVETTNPSTRSSPVVESSNPPTDSCSVESSNPPTPSTENSSPNVEVCARRKGRGLSKKTKDWGEKKLIIDFDEDFQPCGGDYAKLATQLGVFIKDGKSFPLTVDDWNGIQLADIERIWKDVEDNTNAPLGYKPFCIAHLAHQWRDWKYRVKLNGYDAFDTDAERLANRPAGVFEEQWPILVAKWGKEESQKISKTNKINRSKHGLPHVTGKKPLAVVKKKMKDEGKATDRLSLFMYSRTKPDGTISDRATHHMIEQINDALDELPEEDRNSPVERKRIFTDTFGKDGHGRMRCMGIGITPRMVYGESLRASRSENASTIRAEFEAKMEMQRQEMEADFENRLQSEREKQKLEIEAEVSRRMEAELSSRMEAFENQFIQRIVANGMAFHQLHLNRK